MSPPQPPSSRDTKGRFLPGNPGGPGGSRKRTFVLREAAENAITPEHVDALMRKVLRLALEGNLSAARLVLDRTCGRAVEAPDEPEALGFVLPELRTATDCSAAIGELATAFGAGRVDRDSARILLDMINARVKAIETNELEQRLAELERQLGTVETGKHNRR